MSIHYRLITDYEDFLRLREPWNELAGNCDIDHAYMRHEWFSCWIKYLGNKDKLSILTGWQDGLLMAAAPLQILPQRLYGIPLKSLMFLFSPVSPRCNFIIHPSLSSSEVFRQIFCLKGWDLMNLQSMEANLKITQEFLDFLEREHGKNYIVEEGRQSPFLYVDGEWADYFQTLSKKHRKNINQGLNRLSRLDSCNFHRISEFGKLNEIFGDIIRVSNNSWKGAGGTGLADVRNMADFYKEFCRAGEKDGLWELRVLNSGNDIIAFNFFLRRGNRLTGIRTDYDEAFKYYGPGQMMILYTLKDLFGSGQRWEFDMGGMKADFKLDWTDRIKAHINISVTVPGFYGDLLSFGRKNVLPFIKSINRKRRLLGDDSGFED